MTSQDQKTRPVAKSQATRPVAPKPRAARRKTGRSEAEKPQAARPQAARLEATRPQTDSAPTERERAALQGQKLVGNGRVERQSEAPPSRCRRTALGGVSRTSTITRFVLQDSTVAHCAAIPSYAFRTSGRRPQLFNIDLGVITGLPRRDSNDPNWIKRTDKLPSDARR
jgi:hypothetical protein